MVAAVSILERLARRERDARVRPPEASNVRNVHLSDEVDGEPVPAGVDAVEWASWGEAARYVLLERLGVGDELGMDEGLALRLAVVEARLVHAAVPVASWSFVGQVLEVFEGRPESVELRSET